MESNEPFIAGCFPNHPNKYICFQSSTLWLALILLILNTLIPNWPAETFFFKHWAYRIFTEILHVGCFNCARKTTLTNTDTSSQTENERKWVTSPLSECHRMPAKEGCLSWRVGTALGSSVVTFFSHLFWMSTIHPSELKEFSNSTLTLNAAHWFSVTHGK